MSKVMKIRWLVMSLAIVSVAGVASAVTSYVYIVPSDGLVRRVASAAPTYSDGAFWVGYHSSFSDGISRTYISFGNFHELFETVDSAFLEFEVNAPYASTSNNIDVHQVTSPWSGVTWASQPTFDATPAAQYSSTTWGDWDYNSYDHSIDITSLVQAWVDGSAANYGMMLKQDDESISRDVWGCFAAGDGSPSVRLVVIGTPGEPEPIPCSDLTAAGVLHPADFDSNCYVDLSDFADLSAVWLQDMLN